MDVVTENVEEPCSDYEVGILLRPDFRAGSKQRHAVAVWICGRTVAYLAGVRTVVAHSFCR